MMNALNFAYAYVQGGGESFIQLFERCKSALLRIGRKHKGFATTQNCFKFIFNKAQVQFFGYLL